MDGRAKIIDGGDGEKESDEDNQKPQREEQAYLKIAEIKRSKVLNIGEHVFHDELADDKQENSDKQNYGHVYRQSGCYHACFKGAPVFYRFIASVKSPHQCEHTIR